MHERNNPGRGAARRPNAGRRMRGIALGLWLLAPALLADCGTSVGVPDAGGGDCGECVRAINCVKACGGEVVQSGCCPCPEGTFDSMTCGSDAGRP